MLKWLAEIALALSCVWRVGGCVIENCRQCFHRVEQNIVVPSPFFGWRTRSWCRRRSRERRWGWEAALQRAPYLRQSAESTPTGGWCQTKRATKFREFMSNLSNYTNFHYFPKMWYEISDNFDLLCKNFVKSRSKSTLKIEEFSQEFVKCPQIFTKNAKNIDDILQKYNMQ